MRITIWIAVIRCLIQPCMAQTQGVDAGIVALPHVQTIVDLLTG